MGYEVTCAHCGRRSTTHIVGGDNNNVFYALHRKDGIRTPIVHEIAKKRTANNRVNAKRSTSTNSTKPSETKKSVSPHAMHESVDDAIQNPCAQAQFLPKQKLRFSFTIPREYGKI